METAHRKTTDEQLRHISIPTPGDGGSYGEIPDPTKTRSHERAGMLDSTAGGAPGAAEPTGGRRKRRRGGSIPG